MNICTSFVHANEECRLKKKKKKGRIVILTNNKTNQGYKHKGWIVEVRQNCFNVHNNILMEIYINSHC